MKILVISSPDPIRQANIKTQMKGQTFEFFWKSVPAIMYPSQSCVGILRSFKSCIKIAKDAFLPEVLILEDDFHCLSPTSLETFINLWHRYALNDGVLLGGIYEGEVMELFKGVGKVEGKLSGLQAMIVPENLYDIILQAPEPYQLDYHLSMEAKIPIYVAYPFLIIQNDGYSYNVKGQTNYNENLCKKYRCI